MSRQEISPPVIPLGYNPLDMSPPDKSPLHIHFNEYGGTIKLQFRGKVNIH